MTEQVAKHPDVGSDRLDNWSGSTVGELIGAIGALRADLLRLEDECASQFLDGLSPSHAGSARNLLHYVALRRHDIRDLQEKLAQLGLSSLGRAEACVLATIDAVRHVLHCLVGRPAPKPDPAAIPFGEGRALLEQRTATLLGARQLAQPVRVMVTMPTEAAANYGLVRDLVMTGMDCMRINCAHDDAGAWAAMISHLRQAEAELGRRCRVLMDLAGPKLRTGPLEPGPRVVKWRPERDLLGRVVAPARVWLTPADMPVPPPAAAAARLPMPGEWLAALSEGDRIRFTDTRGASRSLRVVEEVGASRWAESTQTAYVATGTVLRRRKKQRGVPRRAEVGELPPRVVPLVLHRGNRLILTAAVTPGRPAVYDDLGRLCSPATVACTLPEIFADVRPGERIWLDDGKIGGVIRSATAQEIEVEITHAPPQGEKLGADKGINLPDSTLRLPALTAKDVADLAFVAAHADLVGLSFVHDPEDVSGLQEQLARLGADRLGIVLKIETRRAFEHLPELLLAALRSPCAGVMIARGDLAVECGYERLAEVQEEILWICEAAHVPVIWATQVLENLAKEGLPSRAEITDAAMAERAECVMLNKGPHILEAMRVLDDILQRMRGHQSKKRAMLRQLKVTEYFPNGGTDV